MIYTPHPVDFRWGPHFGRGREMTIKLLSGQPVGAGTAAERWSPAAGPNIAGIESFDLRHVERLHLELGGGTPICGAAAGTTARRWSAARAGGTPAPQAAESVPVEIRCRGPFHFDVPRRVATFRDGVEVTKLNPSGPADQLTGELLSLYFIARGAAAPANPEPGSLDLVAQRLEARGNPVLVTAPSRDVNARGPRIEYNLLTESIAIDGEKVPDTFSEVFLRQGPNEIHARSLSYQPAGQGRLGRVTAEGPGWLRGQLAPEKGTGPICAQHPPGRSGKLDLSPFPAGGGQQLQAAWREQLRVFPEGQHHVISLTGGAELQSPGAGQLQAREIFFWLNEAPAAGNGEPGRLRPDHMIARYDVRMNSPQLAGEVEQLEVSFENRVQGSGFSGQGSEEMFSGRRYGGLGTSGDARGLGGVPPSDPAAVAAQPQRFKVTGRLLQAHVLLGSQQPGVSHLLVEDGVRFTEEPSAQLGAQPPLQILGDRLEVSDAAGAGAVVAVTGRPAHCEARGLGLTGTTIHLDRGANRLWIDGPGRMDLPPSGGLPGQAAAAGPLSVDWRRRMSFDGQTARFEESVTAATPGEPPQQRLQTDTMQVQLQRLIRFSEPSAQGPPEIEGIACRGGVRIKNRTFDPQGQLLAYDQLQVPDLSVNARTGETTAGGPGWLRSVRRGSANLLSGPAAATTRSGDVGSSVGSANPAASAPTAEQLVCLHVKFQKSIKGTLPVPRPAGGAAPLLRLTFADQVHVAYAPVDRWDAEIPLDDPDKLGPQGMTAHCDQLTVAETLSPAAAARTGEVSATGNAVVEGSTLAPADNSPPAETASATTAARTCWCWKGTAVATPSCSGDRSPASNRSFIPPKR